MHSSWALRAVLVLALGSSGCWFRKAPRTFTPPAARTVSIPAKVEIPPPPAVESDPRAGMPVAVAGTLPALEPPAPPRRNAVPAPKPVQVETPTVPTPAPPRLGQLYTVEQIREYNRQIDESLERVRRALTVVNGRTLNTEQADTVARIRNFLKQAETARSQDLLTAVNLAKRADLLAQDLLSRIP